MTERQKDRKTGRHEVSKIKIQKDNKKDTESLRLTGEFQSGVRNCNCDLTAVAGIASFFQNTAIDWDFGSERISQVGISLAILALFWPAMSDRNCDYRGLGYRPTNQQIAVWVKNKKFSHHFGVLFTKYRHPTNLGTVSRGKKAIRDGGSTAL